MGTKFNVHVALNSRDYERGAEGVARGSKSAEGASASLGRTLKTLSAILGSVGLSVLGAQILKLATDFDTAMTRINTLVGVNRQTLLGWREDLLRMGPAVGISSNELAQALFVVTSAGARGSEALEILRRSGMAATAGLGETKDIARAVTASIQAYGSETLGAAKAVDTMVAIVREGNLESDQLAGVIGRVLGPAAQMGITFDQVGAYIATYSRLGVDAAQATTSLSGLIQGLINPSADAAKALKEQGSSVEKLQQAIREKGLAQALRDLIDLFGGNTTALARVITSSEALAGVLGTAGRQGEAYLGIVKNIAAANGQLTESALAVTKASPEQALKDLKVAGESAAIVLGQGVAAALGDAARMLADFLTTNQERLREFGKLLGELASRILVAAVGATKFFSVAIDVLTAAVVGFGVAWLAIQIGEGIVWLWGLVKAATAAAVAENLLTAATLALGAAWQRLTAAMASNPVGLIAVALGLLAGALVLIALRAHAAAAATEDYHARLRDGRSLIDDETTAHQRLISVLETEQARRAKLGDEVVNNARRLALLEPVLQQAKDSLGKNDTAGYDEAIKHAERLGVVFSQMDKGSRLVQLGEEVRKLSTALESAGANAEQSTARITSTQGQIKEQVEKVAAAEINLRLERRASVAEWQKQLAEVEARLNSLNRGGGPGGMGEASVLGNLTSEAKNLRQEIDLAVAGLNKLDGRIAGLQNQVRLKVRDLFKGGQYDQGVDTARQAQIPEAEIQRAKDEWVAYNDALAEQKRKQQEAADAAKRRIEVLDEEEKKYREVRTDIAAQLADQKRLVAAYLEGIDAGRFAAAALDVEKKGREAAKSVAAQYREEIKRSAEELARWEQRAAIVVDIDEQGADAIQKLATARAELTDILKGNNLASQAAARAAEVEAFRGKFALAVNDARVKNLRTSLELRDRELRYFALAGAAAQRDIDFAVARRTAEAALEDIRQGSAEASRNLAAQLEIENRIKDEGAAGDLKRMNTIAAEVIGRHALLNSFAEEGEGLKSLQESYRELDEFQAKFADTQEARAARKALGSDIAGILEKYGLLNTATKQLAIQEEARARFAAASNTKTLEQITKELEARQRVLDNAARSAAEIEVAQLRSDQFFDSLAGVFSQLGEALGGSSSSIGRIVGEMGNLVGAIGKLSAAGKTFGVDWANAMAGAVASVGALLKSLNVGASGKSGGAQALGGQLDGNYAGIGTIAGTIIGGILAAVFSWGTGTAGGAALGGAIGGVVGSMISKAGDSASATLLAGGNVKINESSEKLNGAVKDALTNIFKGLQATMASLGLLLQGIPFIDIKVRDNIVRVIVGGVVRTFSSMQDAISFGIAEALKQSASAGGGHLPPEILAALKNTTATDLQSLQSDIDFARGIANYGVPLVVQAIDKSISDFYVAMQRAISLGIDTTKVVAQFVDQMQQQKDALLGIDKSKSPQDKLRDDVKAFNQKAELVRAQAMVDKVEIELKRQNLVIAIATAKAQGNLTALQLENLRIMEAAVAQFDVSLASIQGLLDGIVTITDEELAAALARIGKGGKGGGGGAGDDAKSFGDELKNILRSALPDAVRAIAELGDQLVDLDKKTQELRATEAKLEKERERLLHPKAPDKEHPGTSDPKKDAERLRHLEERQRELERLEEQAQAARQILIDQAKKGVLDPVRDYLKPSEGGTFGMSDWEKQGAEIQKVFDDARAANIALGKATGQRAIADWKLVAAQKRAMELLAESAIDSLGNPMEQTRDKVKTLGGTLAFLKKQFEDGIISGDRYGQAMAETRQQAEAELFSLAQGILEKMASASGDPAALQAAADFKRRLEEANFYLQVAQLHYLYEQYKALGLISAEAAAAIDAALAYIDDPKNKPNFSGGNDDANALAQHWEQQRQFEAQLAQQRADEITKLQETIRQQIQEWTAVDLGPATKEATDLRAKYADLVAQAQRLRLSTTDLTAAFAVAARNFVNKALEPFEHLGESDLQARLRGINEQFADLLTAFQTIGASSQDLARLEQARLHALEDFWDQATEPFRQLQQNLLLGDQSPLTAGERFNLARSQYQQAVDALHAGDLSQLERLPDLIQQYLTEAQDRLPQGSEAYRGIFDQIMALLTEIQGMGGTGGTANSAAFQQLLASLGLGNLTPGTGTPPWAPGAPGSGAGGNTTPAPATPSADQQLLAATQQNGAALVAEVRAFRADSNDYLRAIRQNTGATATEAAGIRARLDQPLIASIR